MNDSTSILGIDPGTSHIGWAIVEVPRCVWVAHGTVQMPPESTDVQFGELARSIGESPCLTYSSVVVEKPQARNPKVAAQLMNTSWIGGQIYAYMRLRGLNTYSISSFEWKRLLCGNHVAKDAEVAAALQQLSEVPKRTNCHVRDAAGMAIALGIAMSRGVRFGTERGT